MCVIIVIFFIFIIFLLLLRCLLLRWLLFKKLVNLLLWTSQKLNSYFAVFEQVNWLFCWLWICQKFNSYLGDFEQVNWLFCYFEHVKNLIFILLTLNKSKIKLTTKLPWENLDGYTFFSFFFFFGHHLMSLALHPGFSDLWWSPPALSSTLTLGFLFFECLGIQFFNSLSCDLRGTMPLQKSPTLIPREAEDLPRGSNHSKQVPLPTYLAWLQPIYYNSRLVLKTLIKNIEQQPH